jgi:hypothetical protein
MISFANIAKREFGKLAGRYGLVEKTVDDRHVRYENPSIFLVVSYDNGRSFEIGVEIGQKIEGMAPRPFSLAEILRLAGSEEANKVEAISASSIEKLEASLNYLEGLTARYAMEFLDNNESAYLKLADLRERESIAYAVDRDLRSARARAEIAWKKKNFADFIDAFQPMRSYLSPSEEKHYLYALRKMDHPTIDS